jgi:hypothetical protein
VLEYGFAYGAGAHAQAYRQVIEGLRDGIFDLAEIEKLERINEVLSTSVT